MPTPPQPPAHARNVAAAQARFGAVGKAWVAGLWQGDPLADAFVADLAELGRGEGLRLLARALADGVEAVLDAPSSIRALFAELDSVPDWVDFDQLDRAGDHLARSSLQLGLVLGAASLMVGYTNPAAARPLILTGRLVDNAGVRNLEVGDWLREVSTPGGLRRDGLGFERTVRVRVIHAMVRAHLLAGSDWDVADLGTPISQSYMAHTLAEFGCIAIDGMHLLGAEYSPSELDDLYALWRYVGFLSGVNSELLPATEAEQHAIRDLYQLTRPPIDDNSRALVGGLVRDYLVPEVEDLLPARLPARRLVANSYVNGIIRALIGDPLADDFGLDESRFKHAVPFLGRLTAGVYRTQDRFRGVDQRVAAGRTYRAEQELRLRTKYGMTHDLVDASAAAEHPAAN